MHSVFWKILNTGVEHIYIKSDDCSTGQAQLENTFYEEESNQFWITLICNSKYLDMNNVLSIKPVAFFPLTILEM